MINILIYLLSFGEIIVTVINEHNIIYIKLIIFFCMKNTGLGLKLILNQTTICYMKIF